MMGEHKVRTVFQPEEEITVGDAELTDLTRQGLIVNIKATTDEGARKAAERQVAATEGK